jgi:hypothetical protein
MSKLVGTYYDISRFVLWGDENSNNENKRSRLVFSFRDGNPRITVYTGGTGPNSVISFPSDYPTMVGIINILKDVIVSQPGTNFSIDSLTSVYENNKVTTEKKVVSTLYIGKSKEGLIYFSVISENKPKLVFTIKPSPYHIFKDSEKNVIPNEVISCKIANGIAELILNIISNIVTAYTAEEYDGIRKPTPIKSQQQSFSTSDESAAIMQEIDSLDL